MIFITLFDIQKYNNNSQQLDIIAFYFLIYSLQLQKTSKKFDTGRLEQAV